MSTFLGFVAKADVRAVLSITLTIHYAVLKIMNETTCFISHLRIQSLYIQTPETI